MYTQQIRSQSRVGEPTWCRCYTPRSRCDEHWQSVPLSAVLPGIILLHASMAVTLGGAALGLCIRIVPLCVSVCTVQYCLRIGSGSFYSMGFTIPAITVAVDWLSGTPLCACRGERNGDAPRGVATLIISVLTMLLMITLVNLGLHLLLMTQQQRHRTTTRCFVGVPSGSWWRCEKPTAPG